MESVNRTNVKELTFYAYEYDLQGNWIKRTGTVNTESGKQKQDVAERRLIYY